MTELDLLIQYNHKLLLLVIFFYIWFQRFIKYLIYLRILQQQSWLRMSICWATTSLLLLSNNFNKIKVLLILVVKCSHNILYNNLVHFYHKNLPFACCNKRILIPAYSHILHSFCITLFMVLRFLFCFNHVSVCMHMICFLAHKQKMLINTSVDQFPSIFFYCSHCYEMQTKLDINVVWLYILQKSIRIT